MYPQINRQHEINFSPLIERIHVKMTFDQADGKIGNLDEQFAGRKRVGLRPVFVRVPCGHFVPLEEECQ